MWFEWELSPHRLTYVNTWSPTGNPLFGKFIEPWGLVWPCWRKCIKTDRLGGSYSLTILLVHSLFSACGWRYNFSASCCYANTPSPDIRDSASRAISPNKTFYKLLLVSVFYRSNRKQWIPWLITLESISYLENVLISQSSCSKGEVTKFLNILDFGIRGPDPVRRCHPVRTSGGGTRGYCQHPSWKAGGDSAFWTSWSEIPAGVPGAHGCQWGCLCPGTADSRSRSSL